MFYNPIACEKNFIILKLKINEKHKLFIVFYLLNMYLFKFPIFHRQITGGNFAWDQQSSLPCLTDISVDIPAGKVE